MTRRELLRYITALSGAAVVGADLFLLGCRRSDSEAEAAGLFSEADIAFFDEIAETIIPRTDTPGAKDAQVGQFMATFIADCYEDDQQATIRKGMAELASRSEEKFKKRFTEINADQRRELLQEAAMEAKTAVDSAPIHYFALFQQLSLLGFFTSEPGYTQVLRFEIVPGRYENCVDYKEGETAWANN